MTPSQTAHPTEGEMTGAMDHPLLTAYEALNAKAATASPAVITYDIAISRRDAARDALNTALHGSVLPGWSNLSDAQRADIEAHVRGLNDGAETYSMDKPPRMWRCFHCGEVFRTEHGARLHFGAMPTDRPACAIQPSRPQGEEAIGPRAVDRVTCEGCPAFKSEWWKDHLDNDETDSGTRAHCTAADKHITEYWSPKGAPPTWCPALSNQGKPSS